MPNLIAVSFLSGSAGRLIHHWSGLLQHDNSRVGNGCWQKGMFFWCAILSQESHISM